MTNLFTNRIRPGRLFSGSEPGAGSYTGGFLKAAQRLESSNTLSGLSSSATISGEGLTQFEELMSDSNGHFDLDMVERLTGVAPELALSAYENGLFPMADDRDSTQLTWIEPSERGIIKVPQFYVPKRLARTIKNTKLEVTCDLSFDAVIESCGAERLGREDTWINDQIRLLYGALHRMGFAHSIEVWDDCELVGGLYGVALHGTFFGESMFSTQRDASKIALVHLVARMSKAKMPLLDCQFHTRHLGQFGAIEVPEESYLEMLETTQDTGVMFNGTMSREEVADYVDAISAQGTLPF